MEKISAYMQISTGALLYVILPALFIGLTLYLVYRLYKSKQTIKTLTLSLEEANLDRTSFIANIDLKEDGNTDEEDTFDSENGTSSSLLQQELEEYLLKEQDTAKEVTYHFAEVSADFVDFLKIRSGKIQLSNGAFAFGDMLDDLAKSLRSQLSRMQVELIFHIDTKVPSKLYGDKRNIRLLLFHLLSNIVHYGPGSQLLLYATSLKEGNGLRLQFRVEFGTFGEGMEDFSTLFLPFSESPFDESMRIELYISRALSRMMNGDIAAARAPSGKVEFTIGLLVAEETPEENRYYHLPSRSMLGRKILIVETNEMLAESIKKMYEYFKNEVTLIASAVFIQAPEMMTEYHTVVLEKSFLDLSLTEKIRSLKRTNKVNVVLLLSAKEQMHYTAALGAVDTLLVKPVTIQSVFNTIIKLEETTKIPGMSRGLQESADVQFKGNAKQRIFEEFQGRRILIIDNESANQKKLLSLLGRSGINLSLAQNDSEAQWMLEKLPTFDFILLDSGIDSESSMHLSQKIRRMNRYKGVPIVLMGEEAVRSQVSVIDERVKKPVQAELLYTLLNHYLTSEISLAIEDERNIPDHAFINTVSLAARDGFEMASFDEELYTDILTEFMELYGNSAAKMNHALVKDDLQAIKQLCLDVKGVAGNIGAYRLSVIMAQIHAAISNDKLNDLIGLMNQYQPELEHVKKEILAYTKGATPFA
jgi:DNA-binding response OmpR family regulator/signal transduction histidine kinase/HPt (histidine-containing phosphotransfer) domain-containing protein